jgi:Peptidase family M49
VAMTRRLPAVAALAVGMSVVGAMAQESTKREGVPDLSQLNAMSARFAPVEIAADVSALPQSEQAALAMLVRASRVIDALFLRQVWAGNEAMLVRLAQDDSPLARARLQYFLLNKGPWSRLDHDRPFVPGAPPKPEGANFYPAGASRAAVEQWLASLDAAARDAATGFFTTIRRSAEKGGAEFVAVPYSVEYQGELAEAAGLLRRAASLTRQPTLRHYLEARADALLSNDYYASDVAWMELDASIEPTFGPYEVYEDGWFNRKAAFESFIAVRDDRETAQLERFGGELQDIEDHLPIAPRLRNPQLGALAPIRVVNVIFTAGDANRGVQTAAFNLPNDERVVREKGSKRVMLRNVQEAKFRVVLEPIAQVALAPADRPRVSFDAFFTHILMHELMHGLGPHNISMDGRASTVRRELEDTYSAIEEAKADVSGLWALQYLLDAGKLPASLQESIYTTFLASTFRSIRFGVNEAHGRGIAIQLNFFLDQGAVRVAEDGTFAVVPDRIRGAVEGLTREIMTLQANGDIGHARRLIETLGVVRPEVQRVLDRLTGVPVDIAPTFTTATTLERAHLQ